MQKAVSTNEFKGHLLVHHRYATFSTSREYPWNSYTSILQTLAFKSSRVALIAVWTSNLLGKRRKLKLKFVQFVRTLMNAYEC